MYTGVLKLCVCVRACVSVWVGASVIYIFHVEEKLDGQTRNRVGVLVGQCVLSKPQTFRTDSRIFEASFTDTMDSDASMKEDVPIYSEEQGQLECRIL